jgi:hypothetical protein
MVIVLFSGNRGSKFSVPCALALIHGNLEEEGAKCIFQYLWSKVVVLFNFSRKIPKNGIFPMKIPVKFFQ